MPLMQLKMLVLPAPLGPMMAKKSLALTSRLTPASAATPPKLRCNPSKVSNVISAGLLTPRVLDAGRRRSSMEHPLEPTPCSPPAARIFRAVKRVALRDRLPRAPQASIHDRLADDTIL